MRRSTDIVSGMVEDEPVAAGGGDKGQRNAGIAGCRLDQDVVLPGVMRPSASQRSIIDDADAVLDARNRIEEFELRQQVGA